ncbi:RdgB/HAM1 family non-canonical purine NTP pyrophosphatase [Luminiphilus sp.]|nr:RdgB/HAM1 family non-canonical purine NTP pyrophosphatase [Luminiphilus sp.]
MTEKLPTLVVASHNTGKITEFERILSAWWRIQPQATLGVTAIPETGLSFIENAMLKARHACRETGKAALADDSGLVVPALGGAPGLYSARYSGAGDAANNALLLQNMRAFRGERREAFYIAVLVLMHGPEDPAPIVTEGRWYGHIADAPRGHHGFGYDPLFIPQDETRHAAELTHEEKDRMSHRGMAVTQLLKRCRE